MNELSRAVISARCAKTKQLFGVTFRQMKSEEWHAYWAFPLSEARDQFEGYSNAQISGKILIDSSSYPGCPYCKSMSYARCGRCTKLSCWVPGEKAFSCPWCGSTGEVSGTITQLSGSVDL